MGMRLRGIRIVLGISGGIAAYKDASLVRLFVNEGAEVQVVMTPSAKEFITPLTMSTLSQRSVASEFFDRRDGSWHSHVEMGLWADLMLVAPCTASTLAKMAHGVADNMLITTYLSMKAPTFIAPAMDLDMYAHPTTRDNLEKLKGYGVHVLDAEEGFLASGLQGKGRMMEPESIVEAVVAYFEKKTPNPLRGKRVCITAGPTYEAVDAVRFVGNYSSGKMGFALAEEALALGAEVSLILGPTMLEPPKGVEVLRVTSAREMLSASEGPFEESDIVIFAAAVADYRPETEVKGKMKREEIGNDLVLRLVKNPDIAATLAKRRRPGQFLVGFALETESLQEEAIAKMERKGMDMMVLNSLADQGAGFVSDTNKVTILRRGCDPRILPLKSKRQVASDIFNTILSYGEKG